MRVAIRCNHIESGRLIVRLTLPETQETYSYNFLLEKRHLGLYQNLFRKFGKR